MRMLVGKERLIVIEAQPEQKGAIDLGGVNIVQDEGIVYDSQIEFYPKGCLIKYDNTRGKKFTRDGVNYRLLNERDVIAKLEQEG